MRYGFVQISTLKAECIEEFHTGAALNFMVKNNSCL